MVGDGKKERQRQQHPMERHGQQQGVSDRRPLSQLYSLLSDFFVSYVIPLLRLLSSLLLCLLSSLLHSMARRLSQSAEKMKHSVRPRNTILRENDLTDTLAASSPKKQRLDRKQKFSDGGVPASSDSGVKSAENMKHSGRAVRPRNTSLRGNDLTDKPAASSPKKQRSVRKQKSSYGGVPTSSDSGVKKLCIDSKILQQCHPQHKLVQAEKDAILRTCKDCKARIYGIDLCYKCNDCNEYLHGACSNAKHNPTKPHPFIPDFSLKFSTKEEKEVLHCTACCSYIEGIMYAGSRANKEYRFHPPCIELPPNLRDAQLSPNLECAFDKGMNLELMEVMPTDVKCAKCGTKGGVGWCYGIKYNGEFKLACHVRCLIRLIAEDYIPRENKMADRKQYFEGLNQKYLDKFRSGLAPEVAGVCLDLMISAVVGGPFTSIISAGLGVGLGLAGKKL